MDVIDAGVTLTFRARIPTPGNTTFPLDALHRDGQQAAGVQPYPPEGDGYVTSDGGKGNFVVRQRSGGAVAFSLTQTNDTTGGDPKFTSNSTFIGNEEFIKRYPEITQRVVKTVLLAARWLAEQESKPEPVYQLWTRTGFTYASYKEDWTNESMKYKTSPLIDPYLYARYEFQITEAKRLGLIRQTFDFKEWVEPRFLEAALRELQLEKLWLPRDESGQPKG